MSTNSGMQGPLTGIRVLDLSHALAGPFCSTMLADYGAEVIKIEPPRTGDIARGWGMPLPGGETTYFASLHRNKEGIDLDLKHPEGREIFFKLVERFDVVLENYRVGVIERLGIGYAAARARNPRIIYCSISGFGQTGPYRDRAAFDLILQAESGMISVTGEPGTSGARCGVSIADLTAGMWSGFSILAALHARETTGEGQHIDVSMLEGQLSLLGTSIANHLQTGRVPGPMGTTYPSPQPYQTFKTATTDIAIAVGSDKIWQGFCRVLDRPDIATDPRYRTNQDRDRNRESLVPTLQEIFLTRPFDEWEPALLAAGVPVGAINRIDAVVKHPQVGAREAIAETHHPVTGTVKMVGAPVRFSDTPGGVRTPAPRLGEHTATVLSRHLGLSDADIAALRAGGVIGAEPVGTAR